MLKNRIKKSIGILTMACFLATPISYVISANTTEAAPPPSPRHGRHRKRKTSDKLFIRGFLYNIIISQLVFLMFQLCQYVPKEDLHLYDRNDHKLLFEHKLDDVSLIL